MSPIDDPIHFANVQLLILAQELRNTSIYTTNDLEREIGRLQSYMHLLFQLKHQLEVDTNVE